MGKRGIVMGWIGWTGRRGGLWHNRRRLIELLSDAPRSMSSIAREMGVAETGPLLRQRDEADQDGDGEQCGNDDICRGGERPIVELQSFEHGALPFVSLSGPN